MMIAKIDSLLRSHGISQWGVANNDPPLHLAPRLPRAITLLAGFQPESLSGLENGPTEKYWIEYKRLNAILNKAAAILVLHLEKSGYSAAKVEATLEDYEQVEIPSIPLYTVSPKRDIYIISEPAGQRYVPSPPEFPYGLG